MAFQIDEAHLPATLMMGAMTDDAFAEFCSEHPDLSFELSADGELIIMPRAFTLTGARNNEVSGQLRHWARNDKRGITFDSSTGFVLPNGARRSPDAAWVEKGRIQRLDPATLERYWRLCPDFVIELRSQSDRIRVLRAKMAEWIENGAQIGWLIDPEARTIEVYRSGAAPETISNAASIAGEGPVAGFILDLALVWDPLRD